MIKQSAETSSKDYVPIDLRRNDLEVCDVDRHPMLSSEELSNAGRHHPGLDQPSRAELVPYHSHLVHNLQERRSFQNNLVLRYVPSRQFVANLTLRNALSEVCKSG